MYTIAGVILAAVIIFNTQWMYRLFRNWQHAQKAGFSYWILPLDPNSFFWMVFSIPLKPLMRQYLPDWVYARLSMSVYGFEFCERERMRPGSKTSPRAIQEKTFATIHPGTFEVNTRDPEVALEILRRPKDFMQLELVNLFVAKFGHNVLSSNGEDWARQRKVVASAINERISKTVFQESVQHTEGLIEEVLGEGASAQQSAETTALFDAMKKITINVLSGAGMGVSVHWNDDSNDRPKPGYRTTYIEACRTVVKNMVGPIILPMWFLENYPSWLPGYDMLHKLSFAVKEFPAHTNDLLELERQRAKAAGGGDAGLRNNIMSQLLHAADDSTAEKTGKRALSESEMMGNLFVFTVAGFDTTANTLTYALTLLARFPHWQEWMFAELDSILPSPSDPAATLDYTSLYPRAERVMAILYETLRHFPPLVHITKGTAVPQTITVSSGKTYYFPANSTIYVNTVGIHLDPEVYRNRNLADGETPSDNDEMLFRPTRWINPDGSFFQPPRGTFLPWSAGPRVCPGMKMAQVEFTSVFLTLFWKHRVDPVELTLEGGKKETKAQMDKRLDDLMADSGPIMTLQMNGIYDAPKDSGKGVPLRLSRRKSAW